MTPRSHGRAAPRTRRRIRGCRRIVWATCAVIALAVTGAGAHTHPAFADDMACLPPGGDAVSDPSAMQTSMVPNPVAIGTGGGGVTIAVLDSGVSSTAPALAGAVDDGVTVAETGDTRSLVPSQAKANEDCFGRGTFIASLIAGRPIEGSAAAGLAPEARIFPVRVVDDPNSSVAREHLPRLLAAGVAAAVQARVSAIVIPYALAADDPVLHQAIDAAIASDIVVVAPAVAPTSGGARGSGSAYPASWAGVMAVGPFGGDANRAAELGAVPSVVAPSSGLLGAAPAGKGLIPGDSAELAVGYAAGTVALVRSAFPDLKAVEVIDRIEATAKHSTQAVVAPSDLAAGGLVQDPSAGYGLIDPVAAVTRLDLGSGLDAAPPVQLPDVELATADHSLLATGVAAIVGTFLLILLLLGPLIGRAAHGRRATTAAARATAEARAAVATRAWAAAAERASQGATPAAGANGAAAASEAPAATPRSRLRELFGGARSRGRRGAGRTLADGDSDETGLVAAARSQPTPHRDEPARSPLTPR